MHRQETKRLQKDLQKQHRCLWSSSEPTRSTWSGWKSLHNDHVQGSEGGPHQSTGRQSWRTEEKWSGTSEEWVWVDRFWEAVHLADFKPGTEQAQEQVCQRGGLRPLEDRPATSRISRKRLHQCKLHRRSQQQANVHSYSGVTLHFVILNVEYFCYYFCCSPLRVTFFIPFFRVPCQKRLRTFGGWFGSATVQPSSWSPSSKKGTG